MLVPGACLQSVGEWEYAPRVRARGALLGGLRLEDG